MKETSPDLSCPPTSVLVLFLFQPTLFAVDSKLFGMHCCCHLYDPLEEVVRNRSRSCSERLPFRCASPGPFPVCLSQAVTAPCGTSPPPR